jgi:hypothetical protein
VEAGDVLGYVGGPGHPTEGRDELHVETFSAAKLPGAMGKAFRYMEAVSDGPFVRRGAIVGAIDASGTGDGELTPDELRAFFRNPEALPQREALRHLAIHHVHEWSEAIGEAGFVEAREVSRLSEEDRHAAFVGAVRPYIFLTREVADHAGLPATGAVYSYHPVTFLATLAAVAAGVELRWPARAPLQDRDLGPRPADARALEAWTHEPPAETGMASLFGKAVDTEAITRKRGDIPLIVLPPTAQ